MKFYPPVTNAIIEAIQSIFRDDRYADKVIHYTFKNNRKLGKRDRSHIAESVYGIVRFWRKLWFLSQSDVSFDRPALTELYKIWLYLEGLPREEIENGLGAIVKGKVLDERIARAKKIRVINESLPDWLEELASQEIVDDWPGLLSALNQTAPVFLRSNPLKTSPNDLLQKLNEREIEAELIGQTTIRLKQRANVFVLPEFKEGLFEVQDHSSQQVAGLLDLRQGLRVVDACAGAGGKSLHIASMMGSKGKVLALDIHDYKLDELKKRARRNGISCIEPRCITSSKVIKRLHGTADRLLLDVPCSGLGVLRRNPDTKWKLQPEDFERLLADQKKILCEYSKILKPGGLMVYSTCSILPIENEKQVEVFLEESESFQLVSQHFWRPDRDPGDGFYAAVLRRD